MRDLQKFSRQQPSHLSGLRFDDEADQRVLPFLFGAVFGFGMAVIILVA